MRMPSLALVFLLLATPALGQIGPFQDAESWWLAANGTAGLFANGTTIFVDTNGDGLFTAADHSHPQPAATVGANLNLTPSRRILYARTVGGGAPNVYFYEIPAVSGQPLVLLTGPVMIPNGIAHQGFFDHPGQFTQRIAYVADQVAPTALDQSIAFFDLETGNWSWTTFPLSADITRVQFAPTGIAAFLQHDTDGDALADYTLVDLCAGSLGSIYNVGGAPLSQLPVPLAQASVVDLGGGSLAASVEHPPGSVVATVALNDCATTPATGACCLNGGGCSGGLTAAECGTISGTYQGDGSDCATCPPPPYVALILNLTSPASVAEASNLVHTLQYANNGTIAATNAQLVYRLPVGVTFVAASAGGFYNQGTGLVTWSLGSLDPSETGSATVEMSVPCGLTQVSVTQFYLTSLEGSRFGTPASFPVVPANADPVGVALTVNPLAPVPLGAGDQIEYTITLDNPGANPYPDLTIPNFFLGSGVVFDSFVSQGTGIATQNGTFVSWSGSLAAASNTSLVFRVAVDSCRTASTLQTQLAFGGPVSVRNVCNAVVGSSLGAAAVDLRPPPVLLTLTPIGAGPIAQPAGLGPGSYSLMHEGSTVEFRMRADNIEAAAMPVTMAVSIPGGLTPAGDPPFVGVPPAGTTWTAGSQTVRWSGSVPGFSAVEVVLSATVDSSSTCKETFFVSGAIGSCGNNLSGQLTMIRVKKRPTDPVVLGLTDFQGTWTKNLVTAEVRDEFCFNFEIFTGMAVAPDGSVWLSGLPAVHYNPDTLHLEMWGPSEMTGVGLTEDVAVDPTDGSVVFAGRATAGNNLAVTRYIPTTQQWLPIHTDASGTLTSPVHLEVDPEGRLALSTQTQIVRMDPADPANFQIVAPPVGGFARALALDLDGDYLVPGGLAGGGVRPLWKIDRNTGAAVAFVADLNALQPMGTPPDVLVTAPNGDLYLASHFGILTYMDPAGGTGAFLSGRSPFVDLAYIGDGATPVADVPQSLERFTLAPNVPNPFNPQTTLRFHLTRGGRVGLKIFDLRGRVVRVLQDGLLSAGEHRMEWDGRDSNGQSIASGTYLVRLESAEGVLTRKVALVR